MGAEDVNETLRISTVGKLFLAGLAGYVLGRRTNLRVKGTAEELEAVKNALLASRRFREEMMKPGATVDGVIEKLQLKKATAADFERILGIPWPL